MRGFDYYLDTAVCSPTVRAMGFSMSFFTSFAARLMICAALGTTALACVAGEKEWDELINRAQEALGNGDYVQAERYSREALREAEALKAEPKVVESLESLGSALLKKGSEEHHPPSSSVYREAETYWLRRLSILERTGDSGGVEEALEDMVTLYRFQNRFDDAQRFRDRRLALERARNANSQKQ